MASENTPCATCPWRVDKDATTIPRYSHEKACGLMNTVGQDDDFRKIMACHHSTGNEPPQEQVCKGYLAQEGERNINVRLMVSLGQMASPYAALEACKREGIELEIDYPTVLAKLAVTRPREEE